MHAGGPGRMAAADCAMRGPCSGTDAALLSFLWAPGVLVTQTFDAHLAISPAVVAPMFVVLSADPRIDTPPPRA